MLDENKCIKAVELGLQGHGPLGSAVLRAVYGDINLRVMPIQLQRLGNSTSKISVTVELVDSKGNLHKWYDGYTQSSKVSINKNSDAGTVSLNTTNLVFQEGRATVLITRANQFDAGDYILITVANLIVLGYTVTGTTQMIAIHPSEGIGSTPEIITAVTKTIASFSDIDGDGWQNDVIVDNSDGSIPPEVGANVTIANWPDFNGVYVIGYVSTSGSNLRIGVVKDSFTEFTGSVPGDATISWE